MKNMKTNNGIKRVILVYLLINAMMVNAQLKVTSSGLVGIGNTSPTYGLHFVGGWALFTSQTNGLPISSALIHGYNNYSSATNPDYTWHGDIYTGIHHGGQGQMGFTAGGVGLAGLSYSGPFHFWVIGNVSTQNVWTVSDRRYKTNISVLETPLDKILKLRGVSYEYNRGEYKELMFNEGKNYGLIAQEIQEILPEAVKANDKGYLAVNYNAIIPFLIEAIKEQQKQIENLKQQNVIGSKMETSKASNYNGTSVTNSQEIATLYQNAPNPFNSETLIKYFVPTSAKNANIFVYDISGNKKKSISIIEKGEGSINIAARELGQGTYFYSMLVDGKIVDSKTMLITE